MGLDVTAYSELEFYFEANSYDEAEAQLSDIDNFFVVTHWDYMTERMTPIKNPEGEKVHVYKYKDAGGEISHSYGGYNVFRAWLSTNFIGVPPETVWKSELYYKDYPFAELVHFSDCEGVIGWIAAERISQAFKDNYERAKEICSYEGVEGKYTLRNYERWMKASELASKQGALHFH